MTFHIGLRAPGHLSRTFGHSNGLGPGIVTAVEVLGDISIAITSPSAMSVPMQTNGTAIRVATSGTAAHTALDLSKITLTVQDLGFDVTGAEVLQTRTVGIGGKLFGPYNQAVEYQPNLGEFYLKLTNRLYNQDAKWFSIVTAVNFAAGWLPGQPAGRVTSSNATITRSDSKPYDPLSIQIHCPWFQRVAFGGKLAAEFAIVSRWPKNMSMVACVEAWASDGATTGTVTRQATCARSPSTPNDATLQGKPAATYAVQVDPTGLTAGRCEMRWAVKPWIGPPTFGINTTYAGTAYSGYGVKIYSVGNYRCPDVIPFGYDIDGSHAPLYGCLIYDPSAAPADFVRLIASNNNPATVDVSGLSTVQAGAEASGVYYADLATLLAAVQRVNNSASALTILSDNGLSTKSYARTTTHNDISGGVAVCKPVSGSAAGADFGAYSVRVNASGRPSGLTMAEIRSSSGLPSDTVRWRGRDSGGGVTASNAIPARMRFRGLTLDSTGIATSSAGCAVFDGGSAGIPNSARTEATAVYADYVDSRRWSTTSVGTGFWVHYESGYVWDTRVDVANPQNAGEFNQGHNSLAGLVSSIGSNYHIDTTTSGAPTTNANFTMPPCLLGAKLVNLTLTSGGSADTTSQPKPPLYGPVLHNVDSHSTVTGNPGNVLLNICVPMTAFGLNNMLIRMDTSSVGMANAVGVTNDDTYTELLGANIYGLAVALPNISTTSNTTNDPVGRINWGYQDQGEIRLNKDIAAVGCVARCENVKGDTFPAPIPNAPPAFGATTAYWKGQMVSNAATYYQALTDIPASSGIAITDTFHWRQLASSASVATGAQPLRQGNGDFRDGVDCLGDVYATSASADSPSAVSWFGRNVGVNSKAPATFTNFWNSPATGDFTPKAGGELVNRIPAGLAWSPIDLNGVTMLNDGTDAAGPLQIPH